MTGHRKVILTDLDCHNGTVLCDDIRRNLGVWRKADRFGCQHDVCSSASASASTNTNVNVHVHVHVHVNVNVNAKGRRGFPVAAAGSNSEINPTNGR